MKIKQQNKITKENRNYKNKKINLKKFYEIK